MVWNTHICQLRYFYLEQFSRPPKTQTLIYTKQITMSTNKNHNVDNTLKMNFSFYYVNAFII